MIDLNTRLWGIINPTNFVVIPQSLVLRSIVLGWVLMTLVWLLLTYWNVETSYFQDLQATFRQTLTESAYILKSQATFLGKCINQARPYYDAVRKAKQVRNFVSSLFAAEFLNMDFCKGW